MKPFRSGFVLAAIVVVQILQTRAAVTIEDDDDLPGFLQWLAQYGKSTAKPTTQPPTVAATQPTVVNRPTTGGLLCGMNKYSDQDASLAQMPPYSGPARPNDAPWLARIIDATTYRWFCNGAVISDGAVLVAASCLENIRKYVVVVGDHKFGHMDTGETSVMIERFVVHPHFDKATKRNDFALLFTSLPIPLDKVAVRPVCLPAAGHNSDYLSSHLSVFGWALGGPVRKAILQKESGRSFVKPSDDCRRLYSARGEALHVSPSDTVCLGSGAGDICSADLGSPLTEYTNGRHFLVGIASTVGHGCSDKLKLPAVFARVSSIVPWILAQLSAATIIPETTPAPNRPPPPVVVRPSPAPPTVNRPPPPSSNSGKEVYDLSAPQCGVTKYMDAAGRAQTRIVGGGDAKVNQIPWQVRLIIRGYLCGGTIINKRAIITAAHCIGTKLVSSYRVYAGDHLTSSVENGEELIEISKIIVHEDYSESTNRNDFALLITAKDIPFNTWSIRPACLPSRKSEAYSNWNATISGWGRVSPENMKTPDALKVTSVQIHPNTKCAEAYGSRGWLDPGIQITSEMVCASAPKQDTCQGDSGGPMTVLDNGRHTIVGVTSFGRSCASDKYPGVYARVTSILDWLERNLARNVEKIK